jgi:lysine-specific permease
MSKEKTGTIDADIHISIDGTHRKLAARHLQMIAIGGTIGTGLFLKSGDMIAESGALGSLLAYCIAGISVFCVVMSLGEMATLIPISGSFNAYAERFVDPALGFASGWMYWFQWAMVLPLELTACYQFLKFWTTDNIHPWVYYLSIITLLLLINVFTVSGFGEVEYWLSLLKILAIVVFIVTGVIVIFGQGKGFHIYYAEGSGGPFGQDGPLAIASSMVSACFAFGGTELIGVTAGEAQNPRQAVPRAINGTFWRILIFYLVTMVLIGMIVPASVFMQLLADDPKNGLARSPFVLVFTLAKIPAADHIMNAVGLVAVLSAGNSAVYACSRTLLSLCNNQQGPRFLAKTSKNGVPVLAIVITCSFGLFSLVGTLFGEGAVFNFLINLVGMNIIMTWLVIAVAHIQFRKAYEMQGYRLEDLPYRSLVGVVGDYISIFGNLTVIILAYFGGIFRGKQEFVWIKFFNTYCGLAIYPILFFGYKLYTKKPFVNPNEADLQTGRVAYEEEREDIPKSALKKWIHFLA